ncbi:Cof-type HAD-IIB family hydrolase [Jeotgalibaca dankookensis]|uniref:Cof-type HAD-IIB family hydrolase n=1 Tax=Jeotgalibaca dankookensis TaxID=708126 RepID=UPI000784948D|nr:Cof-type HAD-IIB family hydrolase [Jeotgalibaca dankookensis]
MIKLVAIDIDGTLVNEEKIMSEKVKATLQKAMKQGTKIVLCTGRPITGILPYVEELGMEKEEDFVISQNGAVITRTDTREIIEEWPMELAGIKEWYELSKKFKPLFLVMNEEDFNLIVEPEEDVELEPALIAEGKIISMAVDVKTFEQLDSRYVKAVFFGEPNDLDELEAGIPEAMRENYSVVRSQVYLLEIAAKGIDKGTALKQLAQDLGFEREEVMAIGDGNNDYEMIEAAGLGVVMANGTERLKSIADELTLSNIEDGVAHAIEKFVLN